MYVVVVGGGGGARFVFILFSSYLKVLIPVQTNSDPIFRYFSYLLSAVL